MRIAPPLHARNRRLLGFCITAVSFLPGLFQHEINLRQRIRYSDAHLLPTLLFLHSLLIAYLSPSFLSVRKFPDTHLSPCISRHPIPCCCMSAVCESPPAAILSFPFTFLITLHLTDHHPHFGAPVHGAVYGFALHFSRGYS